MEVIYIDHLKRRLLLRRIPYIYPRLILESPEQEFFDTIEKRNIAIKKLKYNGKLRYLMIAYDKENNHIEIVTIHPISDYQIINRINSGRWLKK